MSKPVVHYKGDVQLLPISTIGEKLAIIGNVVDHPLLGEQEWVRTSKVLDHEVMPDGEIVAVVTQNTIYRKV